jgi:beta-lactamase superfamily II metal-dependent hydrolase
MVAALAAPLAGQIPPRLLIYHFDVNYGDATLIVSPDGRGILIDAGGRGRGKMPIAAFLDDLRDGGHLVGLDYTVATHYDPDHMGGMDEVYAAGWYPEIAAFDRGNSNLPPLVPSKLSTCRAARNDPDGVRNLVPWGTAMRCPVSTRAANCELVEYLQSAEAGGKRKTLAPGQVLELDQYARVVTVVVNGRDTDGQRTDVYASWRRGDCGEDDLSIGLLVEFGDFRYFVAGDLPGQKGENVAEVERLLLDDVRSVDVYRASNHGSMTSSTKDFMEALKPTVVIVSNGSRHCHPAKTVMNQRIMGVHPPPQAVYLTNWNFQECAWKGSDEEVADLDAEGFDGLIEMHVWDHSYRLWRWRNGRRLESGGRQFLIKQRN